MPTVHLPDRILIRLDGPDTEHFLQNIITTDLDQLPAGHAKPGALLTPQGKIMFDFLVSRTSDEGLMLDCRADVADDLLRRLMMYRLRAKVDISKQDQLFILASWDNDSSASEIDSTGDASLVDARFPPSQKVSRVYSTARTGSAAIEDYVALRIAHGVVESGSDYQLSDAFPHDILLDLAGGVGFRKGCYVGQEVVSRMQHRGTARRRVMLVKADSPLPASGSELTVNGRTIGTLGSVSGKHGISIVRIDRVKDALDAGTPIEAQSILVELSIPSWADYTLPQANSGDLD